MPGFESASFEKSLGCKAPLIVIRCLVHIGSSQTGVCGVNHMNNENRARKELINEVVKLGHIIAEFEAREAKFQIREGRIGQINKC